MKRKLDIIHFELKKHTRLYEKLISLLLENIDFNFFAISKDGKYLAKNPALTQVVGDTIHADKVNKEAWESCQEVMRTRQNQIIEEHHNGHWYLSVKSPIIDKGHEVIGVMGVAIDITDKKRLE